ncbi:unnamed protein product, partial [Closterium sp. Yama58-4]
SAAPCCNRQVLLCASWSLACVSVSLVCAHALLPPVIASLWPGPLLATLCRVLHTFSAAQSSRPRGAGGSGGGSGAVGAVGFSVALHKLMAPSHPTTHHTSRQAAVDVLVCARGGAGLLSKRMEVSAQLWAAGIKAEYVCVRAPSLTEQYEHAHEHGIKWLVLLTDAGLHIHSAKVRLALTREVDSPPATTTAPGSPWALPSSAEGLQWSELGETSRRDHEEEGQGAVEQTGPRDPCHLPPGNPPPRAAGGLDAQGTPLGRAAEERLGERRERLQAQFETMTPHSHGGAPSPRRPASGKDDPSRTAHDALPRREHFHPAAQVVLDHWHLSERVMTGATERAGAGGQEIAPCDEESRAAGALTAAANRADGERRREARRSGERGWADWRTGDWRRRVRRSRDWLRDATRRGERGERGDRGGRGDRDFPRRSSRRPALPSSRVTDERRRGERPRGATAST